MSDTGYRCSAWFSHTLLKVFTRVRITGLENIPDSGTVIVAGNHISHFDPYYIGPPIRRDVDFMAMEEFFSVPLIGAWLRWANVYPVRRSTDSSATREAIRRIKAGRLLGIFPERGLRAADTSMLGGAELPRGTMALAHRFKVPVVPCVILGSDRLYQWRDWLRRITVWIRYGPPLLPSEAESDDVFQDRYLEAMRNIYNGMIAEYGLSDDDLPQNPQRRKGSPGADPHP